MDDNQVHYNFYADQFTDPNKQTTAEACSDNSANSASQAPTSEATFNSNSSDSEYKQVTPDTNRYQTTGTPISENRYSPIPPEPPVRKPTAFGKFLKVVGCAVLFGAVASGTFILFNELYRHLRPVAQEISNDMNRPVASAPAISFTPVANSVSVATSDVSGIVDAAMPSLVSIHCTFRTSSSFFGYLYEDTTEGSGSGIILSKNEKELLIATNSHVVADALTMDVTFCDGSVVDATVRGKDAAADLAIVSVALSDIDSKTMKAISLASIGSSDETKVGQMVIAIGNALGYGQTTTVGYLSAKGREINVTDSSTGKQTSFTALQVDAAINPGNSGGALLNGKGEVIGINSAKLSSTSVEGIGYAIPIDNALSVLDELMNREILTDEEKGYLGIYLSNTEITEEYAKLYGWPQGVYVKEVVEKGAAARGGILAGDIITAVNGKPVKTSSQLTERVTSYRSGTVVTITLSRLLDGEYKEMELEITLGSKADFD